MTREHTEWCPERPNVGYVCAAIECPECGTHGYHPKRECDNCGHAACWCVGE